MCVVVIHIVNTVKRTWIHSILHFIVKVVVVFLLIHTLCAWCILYVALFGLAANTGRTSIHTVRLRHPPHYQRDAQNRHGWIFYLCLSWSISEWRLNWRARAQRDWRRFRCQSTSLRRRIKLSGASARSSCTSIRLLRWIREPEEKRLGSTRATFPRSVVLLFWSMVTFS